MAFALTDRVPASLKETAAGQRQGPAKRRKRKSVPQEFVTAQVEASHGVHGIFCGARRSSR